MSRRPLPGALGRTVAPAMALVALAALGGCISLLPRQKPAQLYRFGVEGLPAAASPAAAAPAARVAIRAAPITFEQAAGNDRILTVRGDEIAYVAGARWVTSARSLFDDAVDRAFGASGGPARLLARDEPAVADYVLKLDVRTFETRYGRGAAAPTVVVELYAALVGRKNADMGPSQTFRTETPADSDSVHAIARAYDIAVAKVLGEMVAWTESKAAA